jgi:hypothetical protein
MTMNLKSSKVTLTSDGKPFTDRAEAVKHETGLIRTKRVHEFLTGETIGDDLDKLGVEVDLMDAFLVKHADTLIELLTVKQSTGPRGPRAPKVATAPATTTV